MPLRNKTYTIKNIFQKDNHSFQINWSDEISSIYTLAQLQSHCPCAQCQTESLSPIKETDTTLRAKQIISVGRYALRIVFTKGCSQGIYSFDLLRKLDGQL